MFVKKIPKWKIKRFFKGIIRTILYFVVISSFLVLSCSADSISGIYDNFGELIDDDLTKCTVSYTNGSSYNFSPRLYPSKSKPYMFYALQNSYPIYDCVFEFFGDNVLTSFSANDVFIFSGTAEVSFKDTSFDSSTFAEFCSFRFGLRKDNDDSYRQTLKYDFSDFEYESHYNNSVSSPSYGDYVVTVNFSIEYSFAYSGYIDWFEIHLGSMESATAFTLYPAQTSVGDKIVYYVGSKSNAPQYSSVSDSSFNDLTSAEDSVLNRFEDDELNNFSNWADTFWNSQKISVGNWLGAASSLFSVIYNRLPWQLTILFNLFLVLGVLGFLLNLVGAVIKKRK